MSFLPVQSCLFSWFPETFPPSASSTIEKKPPIHLIMVVISQSAPLPWKDHLTTLPLFYRKVFISLSDPRLEKIPLAHHTPHCWCQLPRRLNGQDWICLLEDDNVVFKAVLEFRFALMILPSSHRQTCLYNVELPRLGLLVVFKRNFFSRRHSKTVAKRCFEWGSVNGCVWLWDTWVLDKLVI